MKHKCEWPESEKIRLWLQMHKRKLRDARKMSDAARLSMLICQARHQFVLAKEIERKP